MNPEIDFISLLGQAGTGKTLLTLAAGLMLTLEHKVYSEIIMTRVTVPVGEDIGFLPGTEEEKMNPWMGALEDNLDVLNKTDDDAGEWGRAATRDLIRSRIKVKSLNFMRGRTFINKFLIIDEAQNLTPKQMKTMVTRAGPGTKVVCLGNIAQIDTPYLTEGSSGITYVVDRFKGWAHSGPRHPAARRALAARRSRSGNSLAALRRGTRRGARRCSSRPSRPSKRRLPRRRCPWRARGRSTRWPPISRKTGHGKRALALAGEARAIAESLNDSELLARALHTLARCHFYVTDFVASLELLLEATRLYRAQGDLAGATTALAGVGLCQHRLGAQEDAIASLLAALESARDLKLDALEINIHNSLASVCADVGTRRRSGALPGGRRRACSGAEQQESADEARAQPDAARAKTRRRGRRS
jgi:tetratricopeptide (TPR) repeat protein